MQAIDLIRENLRRSEDVVFSRIEDMREHCMVPCTANGGAHTLWLLGHLAYIEALVIRRFMLGEANPLAGWEANFDGDAVSTDAGDFPGFDRVLEECRGTRAATVALLDSYREDALDRKSAHVPEGAETFFGTFRHCFQYAADHWWMHRGQLADARRAAGIDRMWY